MHPATYTNPVYTDNFPDPFVLRFNGRYYAYGTGTAPDGLRFPMLSSRDLVHWTAHGGALAPLDLPGAEAYWAPEVAYSEGHFYMYYATGQEANPDHHLRLAVAEHPLGPWQDAGLNLTPHEIFAIDAHPFRDPRDGQWYLFYARDELDPPYAGTGNVVDRLLAMDRLEGNPRKVVRPFGDWQVFELNRVVKGGLDWYTVEGPFTVFQDGRYVSFYSGGRWENPNYGVGYAVADHPLGPWVDDANQAAPQVLTTVPGRVIGPGHNSVVIGPDLRTRYLVYHGWDPGCIARYPRIDRLSWRDGRPVCDGPSSDPRPVPRPPDVAGWFDERDPGPEWERIPGAWRRDAGALVAATGRATLTLSGPERDFIAEIGVFPGEGGEAVLAVGGLEAAVGDVLRIGEARVPLPGGFRAGAWHRLLVRREAGTLTATLDEFPTVSAPCPEGAARIALRGTEGARLSHFALSRLT